VTAREVRLLVVDNANDARTIREMLDSADGILVRIQCAESLVAALNALAHHTFDAVLVELSLSDSEGLATFETIQRHARDLPIVIHTGTANESLALTSVERGAQDYLIKGKLTSAALVRVLQYSIARRQNLGQSGRAETPEARVTGFLAAKGGVGATTVASHFSLEMRRQSGAKVLLMDVDCSSRSAAFLLKIESRYSVVDAATNLHRLDAEYWKGVVAATPGGLDVLQAPGAAGFTEQPSGERVRHVLRFAKALYAYIVVDLGRLNPVSLNLLEEINEVYVIATDGLPEMYEAGRVLRKLGDLGFANSQVRLVFNRISKSAVVSGADIEKALGHPVFWKLGDYSREMENAYSEGRFLDEGLTLRKQVAQWVAKTLGVEPKPPPRGMMALFKLARA
jgi:Flp pilus assembly CpaE family ATPase